MHDVDLIFPVNFVEKYYGYKKDIIHFGKNVEDYYDYNDFVGGAIQFSTNMFEKINGFPNHIYGWGGEDDALIVRILNSQTEDKKIVVYRPDEGAVGKEMTNNNLEEKEPLGNKKKELVAEELIAKYKNEDVLLDEMIWKMNGLNPLHYKVMEKQQMTIGVYNIVVDIH
jgi:hypothetical protein